jgi:hypothetical protein
MIIELLKLKVNTQFSLEDFGELEAYAGSIV